VPKPRVLVTGATGKTGSPTTLGLLERGYPVRAFVRQLDQRGERLRQAGAEITVGSLEDFRDLRRALKNVDRAYFCPPLGACPSSGGIFGTNLIPLRHEQTFSSLDN
jgi:NAD(P)H dehydrogenase (quinone)